MTDKMNGGKEMTHYSNMVLSIELKKCDYTSVIEALKKKIKTEDIVVLSALELAAKFPEELATDCIQFVALVYREKALGKVVCQEIEKILVKNHISINMKEVSFFIRGNGNLCLNIEAENYDYEEIFGNIADLLAKKVEGEISQIATNSVKVLNEMIPNEIKDRLVVNLLNKSSEILSQLIEKIAEKELGIHIVLENVQCEVRN